MTHLPLSPETESALSVLIKQYALDLRRNASGGDDYPYDFAKGVADYLGVLIKRAKGNCTCAQDGFPDSCDNCDAFGLAQCQQVPQDVLLKMHHLASVCCDEDVLRWFDANPAALSDTSTDRTSK